MALIPRPKFPKTIRLPFVAPIPIRYISEKRMQQIAKQPLWGYWTDFDGAGKPTIFINKDTPLWEQADTLYHEIGHALTDTENRVRKGLVEPMKVEAGMTMADMREDDDD